MTAEGKAIQVEIYGETYYLRSDGEEAQAVRAARVVNGQMKKLSAAYSQMGPHKLAILTALNLAEAYLKLETEYRQVMQMLEAEQKRKHKK